MSRSMYRYAIPIDDQIHTVSLTHYPVYVVAVNTESVEFWAEHDDDAPEFARSFRVFGTGHRLPPGARWVGTCPRTEYGLVWHLYDVSHGSA